MEDLVIVNLDGGIGELVLNRPEQRNSLTGPLVRALQGGLEKLLQDENCRVIIIRGQNGFFCAGLDLKAFTQKPEPEWKADFQKDWAKFHRTIFYANKPIIGAIEGFAIAGGSALALACDFMVIGEKSFFHVMEAERGMLAPINILWLTLRHSYSLAQKLALLAQRFTGQEVVDIGVADLCVSDEKVLIASREMAKRLAGFEAGNLQKLKQSIRSAMQFKDFDELLVSVRV
ncbi:MAG: enoyl-CoA hydratase/isomerase family protein [Pseudomonadales bacterium]|nr:enoyl-CoA hydratase/isomerase family protein [Pseudomonadales bacterium]